MRLSYCKINLVQPDGCACERKQQEQFCSTPHRLVVQVGGERRSARYLEGSRFTRRQFYRVAAGGSREWPSVLQFYRSPGNGS